MATVKDVWNRFGEKHPSIRQFLVFFILSNGITALQMAMLPLLRGAFAGTDLLNTNFQVWAVGTNRFGEAHYIFDFAAGAIADGGRGGLAFFLAMQISLLVAQVINFFAQRNITFKSNTSMGKAAMWYGIAYVVITIVAAAALGLYGAPIYNLFMNTFGMGAAGETIADALVMIINSAISFWVFFPIFKVIFKRTEDDAETADALPAASVNVAEGLELVA